MIARDLASDVRRMMEFGGPEQVHNQLTEAQQDALADVSTLYLDETDVTTATKNYIVEMKNVLRDIADSTDDDDGDDD